MTDRPRAELLKGQAYKLFLEEIEHNIAFTTEILEMEPRDAAARSGEIRLKFHSIKGASGFFGFARIARVAGKLEACAVEGERTGRLDSVGISASLAELAQLAKELPEPG